jgi:hypothetical protein
MIMLANVVSSFGLNNAGFVGPLGGLCRLCQSMFEFRLRVLSTSDTCSSEDPSARLAIGFGLS